jgi:hypothetical protein
MGQSDFELVPIWSGDGCIVGLFDPLTTRDDCGPEFFI